MAERDKAIEMAMSQIERQFGKGAIMRMGDKAIQKIDTIRPVRFPSTWH